MKAPYIFLLLAMLTTQSFSAENATPKNKIEPGSAEEKAQQFVWACTPNPHLPNVLLLGDSISIGYTLKVRSRLANIANVYRPLDHAEKAPANCADTGTGIKNLHKWLGDKHWDVIHFNFGLHDLKYLDKAGKYVTPDQGKQVTLPEIYATNLRQLVGEMKKTGASLIWCSTTPIPEGAAGRVKGDEVVFNAIAEKVMKENGVAIDDLYSLMAPRCAQMQKQRDVHFTEEGSDFQAAAVADIIQKHLPGKTQ